MANDQQVTSMRSALRDLAQLGFADALKPVTDKLAVVDAIDTHVAALVDQARAARDRLVAGLADGSATLDDLTLFAAISAGGTHADFRATPMLGGLAGQAKASAHRDAYAAGVKLAPGILDKLAKLAPGVVAKVAAAKLPADAWTELDALRGDPVGYRAVLDGHAELTRLHAAYAALRRCGWLPELREAGAAWLCYGDPLARPVKFDIRRGVAYTAGDLRGVIDAGDSTRDIPAALALWHACRVGAAPGFYTIADAEARYAAWVAAEVGGVAVVSTTTRRPRTTRVVA